MNYKETGQRIIHQQDYTTEYLPLVPWTDFNLRFTIEYPVKDILSEVGFYHEVLGLQCLSTDSKYVIFTDPQQSYTFSIQYSPKAHDLSFLRLQLFTDDFHTVIQELEKRPVHIELFQVSEVQYFVRMISPAGMPVEIWSGDLSK